MIEDRERLWAFNGPNLEITMGICGDAQEGSFGNATLQSTQGPYKADLNKGYLEFSIAVHVEVPSKIRTEDDLADFLGGIFGDIVSRYPELKVEIQLGPAGDGEEARQQAADVAARRGANNPYELPVSPWRMVPEELHYSDVMDSWVLSWEEGDQPFFRKIGWSEASECIEEVS